MKKIIKLLSHTETGFGTHTIIGLGDDNKIYEWKHGEWKLRIRGELVSRDSGKIIGFFGLAGQTDLGGPNPPWEHFALKGIGLIIIHGID